MRSRISCSEILPARNAQGVGGFFGGEGGDPRVGHRHARAVLVDVIAGAGFLAEAALLA